MRTPDEGTIEEILQDALDAQPDVLIVLAGDGTASLAADLCGPKGPMLVALPGGTMNMLPRALYGNLAWRDVVIACLEQGQPRAVSCGEVDGQRFYCVAILGSPAFWQPAREAARSGRLIEAWSRAVVAFRRAFTTRLRFQVEGCPKRRAIALSLICPTVSKALDKEKALEAAGLDLHDVIEVFRLGLNNMMGDWRRDPSVTTELCVKGRAWGRSRIPCLLDGEMTWLPRSADIRFVPKAFSALAPPLPPASAPS